MKIHQFLAAVAAALITAWPIHALAEESASAAPTLAVAQLTADGNLRKPADLASWVFLGASLGMGYNPGSFNAAARSFASSRSSDSRDKDSVSPTTPESLRSTLGIRASPEGRSDVARRRRFAAP